jgi:hypothetical protein
MCRRARTVKQYKSVIFWSPRGALETITANRRFTVFRQQRKGWSCSFWSFRTQAFKAPVRRHSYASALNPLPS